MTVEILPTAGYWAAAVFAVAAVGAALIVGTATEFLLRNRTVRLERNESIPSYYRALAVAA